MRILSFSRTRRRAISTLLALSLAACGTVPRESGMDAQSVNQRLMREPLARADVQLLDRISWGVSPTDAAKYSAQGRTAYLNGQLHPRGDLGMPAAIQAQINGLTISKTPLLSLIAQEREQNEALKKITDPSEKQAARQAEQTYLNTLAREAATRSLLRDIYASDQLREQLVWFWFNHFNITQNKADIRLFVGDYEEHAIRPYALGTFRDLLGATLRHPAMLLFLDNSQNAAGRLNENYAREIMELHTMGVGSGYTQTDVQELARILTGVGVNENPPTNAPVMRGPHANDYVRNGAFEFNPNRHDYGTKHFLGHTIQGAGMREVNEALDLIAKAPATAHFISRQLAMAFVSDNPPPALVNRMAATFQETGGDIADVMQTMIASPEFPASLDKQFKDPIHYAVSAIRLSYDTRPIRNVTPVVSWLNRMGESLYGRETPDGYPLMTAAWSAPGQMATRFDIARAIGSGGAGLFRLMTPDGQGQDEAAFPQLNGPLFFASIEPSLSTATRQALGLATTPQEWNTLFLASPEMMHR